MTYTERNPQVYIINVIIITFEEDEKLFKKNSMRMRYGCILLFSFYRFCLFFSLCIIILAIVRSWRSVSSANISHISRASDIIFVCFFFVHLSLQLVISLVHFTVSTFRYVSGHNWFYTVEENSILRLVRFLFSRSRE